MAHRVLVVDHEQDVCVMAQSQLSSTGMEVRVAASGVEAMAALAEWEPDMIILDLVLQDVDGVDLCRRIRQRFRSPVLVLADANAEVERLLALEVGADDYFVKPLQPRDFVTRVRAHLRRWLWKQEESAPFIGRLKLAACGLVLDLESMEATMKGTPLHLTPTEFHLLRVLCQSPGTLFPRDRLLALAMGRPIEGDARQVDVHVRSIRRKLEQDPGHPEVLQTVRGAGYRMCRTC